MFHPRRHECHRRVACGAIVVGQNVFGVFTCRGDVVMATRAGSFRAGVVHAENGCEVVARVAERAIVGAGDVVGRLGCRADAAADHVAAGAVTRCAFEYTIDVAVFASHVPVRVTQLEAGGEVIEAGALHRRSVGARDEEECE